MFIPQKSDPTNSSWHSLAPEQHFFMEGPSRTREDYRDCLQDHSAVGSVVRSDSPPRITTLNADESSPAVDELNTLLQRLEQGDDAAGRAVFLRFARRMIELAERNLALWLRNKVEPEDIVQSVFRSFFTNCPTADWQFADWNSLWELLAKMTVCKCAKKAGHWQRQKRSVQRERTFPDDGLTIPEPTPDEVVEFTDLLATLLRSFEPRGQTIITLILGGFTVGEIAERVGCSRRTVFRTLNRAETALQQLGLRSADV